MLSSSIWGQDKNTTNLFFESIKNLDYKEALVLSGKIEEYDNQKIIQSLASLIIHNKPISGEFEIEEIDSEEIQFLKCFFNGHYLSLKYGYDSTNSFEYYIRSLYHAEASNNVTFQKTALIAILNSLRYQIFIGSNQYEQYLKAYRKIESDLNDKILLVLYEIIFYSKADATLKHREKDYNVALKKMDSIFSVLPDEHPYMPYYFHEKGIEYKFSYQSELAEYYFLKVEEMTKGKNKYRRLNGTNYWQLSDMYINAQKYERAYQYLEKSRNVAENLKDTFYDNRLAARYFKGIGDYRKAHDYLKSSIDNEYVLSSKNYSFMSNQLSRQFKEEAEVKFKTAEKEKQILEEQQKVRTNRNWLIIVGVVLLFGTGIAILLQKNTTKKRLLVEQEVQLQQQHLENLLKEQELVSIDAMIEGQEKERQKVANELHDDLGSLMATIKLHFENAEVSKIDPALQNAQKLLEEAYQKIRGMAHSKNSGVMSDQGLLPAIKKMAESISESNALQVTVEDFGMGERMENSLELSIFRTVQELVANAIKHAEATKINIQLTQHQDNLNIIVEDNGKGFDRFKLDKEKSGMGLTNIEKRVEHLGGNFTVDSVLDKGTSILIDIPV